MDKCAPNQSAAQPSIILRVQKAVVTSNQAVGCTGIQQHANAGFWVGALLQTLHTVYAGECLPVKAVEQLAV